MSVRDEIATLQRQQSDALSIALMRASASDAETKARLTALLDATEKSEAAKDAAEKATAKAEAATEAADKRIAEAETLANTVAAEAESWRRTHNQQVTDLHASVADLEKQRAALAAESLALDAKRIRHAHTIATLRNYLAGEDPT